MSERQEGFRLLTATRVDEAVRLIGRLYEVASPSAVFGAPMQVGERTVFTASEATVSMGVGFGFGEGLKQANSEAPDAEREGGGGGGGGGGYGTSRAVAVVSVGADGVRVEPIFDVTKIALAFVSMFGTLLVMQARMRRAMKG